MLTSFDSGYAVFIGNWPMLVYLIGHIEDFERTQPESGLLSMIPRRQSAAISGI